MALSIEVAGKSDVGCVRTNNEDNLGYDTRYGIFLVCDGMGGQAAGEVASKMAVDTVLNYFRESGKNGFYPQVGEPVEGVSERAGALASAIHLANEAIFEAAHQHAAQAGMGSTIVAVLFKDEFLSVGHVGDSRIYLMRNGELQQLTQDHSLVAEQVRRGLITKEEAEHSDVQNIILKALGPEEHAQPDLDDLMARPGDLLLMCSDGLTREVKDDRIQEIINEAPNLRKACEGLIEAARAHGGNDNVTCLLLRIVQRPWYKRMFGGEGRPRWQDSL